MSTGKESMRVTRASAAFFATFLLTSLLTPLFSQEPSTQASSRKLTVEEARELVQVALEPGGATKLPGFQIEAEPPIPEYPDFYYFEALWHNPGKSAVIGNYAVDPRTGDVWVSTVCKEMKSKVLKVKQKEIRNRIGLSDEDYKKIKKLGPMC
jgi:hypothetical protein